MFLFKDVEHYEFKEVSFYFHFLNISYSLFAKIKTDIVDLLSLLVPVLNEVWELRSVRNPIKEQ